MYSYTLTFREEADKLTAPEHEIRLQSPAQAGDFIILSDGSRHQVMFVTHRAHSRPLQQPLPRQGGPHSPELTQASSFSPSCYGERGLQLANANPLPPREQQARMTHCQRY